MCRQFLQLGEEIKQFLFICLEQFEETVDIENINIIIARKNARNEPIKRRSTFDSLFARIYKTDLRLQIQCVILVDINKKNIAFRILHRVVRHIKNAFGLAGAFLSKDDLDHGQYLPFIFR